jgi:hypothetical protein
MLIMTMAVFHDKIIKKSDEYGHIPWHVPSGALMNEIYI